MKTLTKKYRLILNEDDTIADEQTESGITYVPKDKKGLEFDTLEELEQFISDNNLIENAEYQEENRELDTEG